MVDVNDLMQAPVFGLYSQKSMDYIVAGKQRESRLLMDGYELQFDEPAGKIKLMAMIPGAGAYIAYKRVQLVNKTDLPRGVEMAHYVRAVLEAIPLLGALILLVADRAVDAYRYIKTKTWQLDSGLPLFEREIAQLGLLKPDKLRDVNK